MINPETTAHDGSRGFCEVTQRNGLTNNASYCDGGEAIDVTPRLTCLTGTSSPGSTHTSVY